MSNNSEPGCLNSTVGKIGTIGAILAIVLATIPIVQAMLDSRQQGHVDATAIAIQAAQLDVMIEQATLEALQSTGFDNNATATLVAERLIDLQGTSTALEISALEGTIAVLERQQPPQNIASSTPVPATATRIVLPNTATPQPLADIYEMTVQADEQRNQTGIHIETGDMVSIQFLEGRWRAGPLPTWPFYGPSGDPQVESKETFPVQDKPIMGLVGGIGTQQPFWVGSTLQFKSSTSGELWLGANDDDFSDNNGYLIVTITISKEQP